MSQQENGAGSNGDLPSRRRSGFASPDYWTPERREEKRQWAKQMVAEGRIGGRQPGAGRPRKQSVAEVVAEKSAEKGDKIASKLLDLALNHKAPSVNLGAIDRLNKYEQDYEKNMRDDEKELRKLSGKSLDEALKDVLAEHGIGYDYELSPEDIEDDD